MAWTLRGLLGLSFGLASLVLAGCDSGGDDGGSGNGGNTNTTTTGGGTLEGTPIPFTDGWAPLTGNPFMIQGAFYTFKDNPEDPDADTVVGTSTISPEDFGNPPSGTQVCATGNAGQVMDGTDGMPAYDDYWGAAIGFNLKQEVGMDEALPFDATTAPMGPITGFSFNVAGDAPLPTGGELRFNIKVAGDDHNYCKKIIAAGPNSVRFTELLQSCWEPEQITPDATKLEALHWQYVTNDKASYDFNLCITELRALTD